MPPRRTVPRRAARLCLAVACLFDAATAVAQRAPSRSPDAARAAAPVAPGRAGTGPLRVLFVGNSYTYYLGLPDLVAQLSAIAGGPRPLAAAQVTVGDATPFPAEWAGRWAGELEILAADGSPRTRVPMALEVGGAPDSTGHPFRITYGEGSAASTRDYRLRAVAGDAANAFVIDERNGIVLDARRFGASLVSVFRVGDRVLQTSYTFAGDELRFEVLFWGDVPGAAMHGQGANGERGAEVRSFVPTGRQVALLRRVR